MRRVWALAAKDILETRRDKLAGIFTIVMPLAFTLVLGLIFSGGNESRYPLVVSNQDYGQVAATGQRVERAWSQRLIAQLRTSDVITVTMVSRSQVDERVNADKAAAGLIIPDGYSSAVASGNRARLVIVRTAGSAAAQSVAQEIRSAAEQQVAFVAATNAAVAAGRHEYPDSLPANTAESAANASVGVSLRDPALGTKVVASGSSGEVPNGFDLTSPGMIVNFILFGISTAGVALIMERRSGTLQRLLTTRATRGELIGGKIGGMMTLTFVQQIVLIAVGALAFGVGYFNAPLALLLVMISLSVLVSCLGLLLATLFTSEQALIAATVMISMAWAAMSGGWFPLEITGPTFSAIGHALPTAWIIDAFRGISLKDWGVAQVLPAVGVALAWAAGFFVLGVWRFRSVSR